jgi:predicted GIY-YIG superfamily endonuclease
VSAWVYLLRCADDSLYCGWTIDLDRRLARHEAGTASAYTRSRRPVALAVALPMADNTHAQEGEAAAGRPHPRPVNPALVLRRVEPGHARPVHAIDSVVGAGCPRDEEHCQGEPQSRAPGHWAVRAREPDHGACR